MAELGIAAIAPRMSPVGAAFIARLTAPTNKAARTRRRGEDLQTLSLKLSAFTMIQGGIT